MQLNDRTQKSLQFSFNSDIMWFLQIISVKDSSNVKDVDDVLDVQDRSILGAALSCVMYGMTFKDYGWYGGGGVVSVPVLFSNNGSSACSELPASAKVELFSSAK